MRDLALLEIDCELARVLTEGPQRYESRHNVRLGEYAELVDQVVAHTLLKAKASTGVLGKLGMRKTGEVIDPENGPVWR